MSWSQDPNTYKVVFLVGDAPPHMDYQDDVKYPQTLAPATNEASSSTRFSAAETSGTAWQQIAALERRQYFQVDQAGSAVAIDDAVRRRPRALSATLDATRLYYGDAEVKPPGREGAARPQAARRRIGRHRAHAAPRSTSPSGRGNLGDNELVADVASGRVDIAEVPPAAASGRVAACPAEEQRALVDGDGGEARALQRQIAALATDRDAYIAAEVEASGGAEGSLDQQIYDAVRSQAAPLGLDYEDGPRF